MLIRVGRVSRWQRLLALSSNYFMHDCASLYRQLLFSLAFLVSAVLAFMRCNPRGSLTVVCFIRVRLLRRRLSSEVRYNIDVNSER